MILHIAPDFYVEYGRGDVSEEFDFEVEGGVATVTLNRPDKLNALTFGVYGALRDLVIGLPQRGDVRVLVITGRGPRFLLGR